MTNKLMKDQIEIKYSSEVKEIKKKKRSRLSVGQFRKVELDLLSTQQEKYQYISQSFLT